MDSTVTGPRSPSCSDSRNADSKHRPTTCHSRVSNAAVVEHADATANVVRRYVKGAFELPAEGVELPVYNRGRQVGRFVLVPSPGDGITLEQRVVALALADQVGAVHAE